jgi:hypothetical protein
VLFLFISPLIPIVNPYCYSNVTVVHSIPTTVPALALDSGMSCRLKGNSVLPIYTTRSLATEPPPIKPTPTTVFAMALDAGMSCKLQENSVLPVYTARALATEPPTVEQLRRLLRISRFESAFAIVPDAIA